MKLNSFNLKDFKKELKLPRAERKKSLDQVLKLAERSTLKGLGRGRLDFKRIRSQSQQKNRGKKSWEIQEKKDDFYVGDLNASSMNRKVLEAQNLIYEAQKFQNLTPIKQFTKHDFFQKKTNFETKKNSKKSKIKWLLEAFDSSNGVLNKKDIFNKMNEIFQEYILANHHDYNTRVFLKNDEKYFYEILLEFECQPDYHQLRNIMYEFKYKKVLSYLKVRQKGFYTIIENFRKLGRVQLENFVKSQKKQIQTLVDQLQTMSDVNQGQQNRINKLEIIKM